MLLPNSVNIGITVTPLPNDHCLCEATLTVGGQAHAPRSFHGQNPNHALAMALEDLAREFRLKAEAEQKVDWEAVERSTAGVVLEKRFHVVLHYERVAEDESKFDAMHNTILGNTVIENAEISLVQVDKELPMERWRRREKHS